MSTCASGLPQPETGSQPAASIVTSVVNAHQGHLDAEALPNGGMRILARLQKTTVGT